MTVYVLLIGQVDITDSYFWLTSTFGFPLAFARSGSCWNLLAGEFKLPRQTLSKLSNHRNITAESCPAIALCIPKLVTLLDTRVWQVQVTAPRSLSELADNSHCLVSVVDHPGITDLDAQSNFIMSLLPVYPG
jgi:hypothetical protein